MGSSVITSSLVHLLLLHLLLAPFSTSTLISEDVDVLPLVTVAPNVALQGNAEEAENVVRSCISSNIASALLQAKITKENIDEFKENYTKDKFNMTWATCNVMIPEEWDESVLEVCSVDQTCSTVLPPLPPSSTPLPVTDIEAAEKLTQIFGHVLRFMYAFEQMVLDQAFNEDVFEKEMHEAYSDYDKLARHLEVVQKECGMTPDASTLASLHGKMYVTTSNTQTQIRGFCTLRQSLQGLNLLLDMFLNESSGTRRMEDEEEEEEEEERRNSRRRKRTKNGRDKRNGKNRKGSKRRKRRRNNLD